MTLAVCAVDSVTLVCPAAMKYLLKSVIVTPLFQKQWAAVRTVVASKIVPPQKPPPSV